MSKIIAGQHEVAPGTARSYVVGFVLSLLLTITAYVFASYNLSHGWGLVYSLSALAVSQLAVQLICFLHVGRESKPHWNLQLLIFAIGVVGIVVFGSLWIMKNLNYNHHPRPSTNKIIKDEGYQP